MTLSSSAAEPQRTTIAADIGTNTTDLDGVIAKLKQDPHNRFLAKEVTQLEHDLTVLRTQLVTVDEPIATQCSGQDEVVLVSAGINFSTHADNLETASYVNVFVRNQPRDGSIVLQQRDLITNRLDWERHHR